MIRAALALLIAFMLFCGFAGVQRDRVETICGPSVSTPAMLHGIQSTRGAGETLRGMIDGDGVNTFEIVRFVFRAFDMAAMFVDSFGRALTGSKPDGYATQWEKRITEKQQLALESCCVAPAPAPDSPDRHDGDAGDDWDPKNASLQSSRKFSPENLRIAKVVVAEARRARVGSEGAVVALTAGMQESGPNGPRNLNYGHSSSVGVWQLIDLHGSVAQRMDVEWSARWFFRQLRAVDNWRELSVNDAAQAVERSAHPDRYGRWERDARALLAAVGPDLPVDPGEDAGACVPAGQVSDPDAPVPGDLKPPADPGGKSYNLGRGIQPAAQRGADILGHRFAVRTIGGVRPDSMPYHPSGRAIDLMCTRDQGDRIAAYAKLHAGSLKVDHIIWRQRIWSPQRAAEGWRHMPDRGSVSANHYDHVHITFLTGAQQA